MVTNNEDLFGTDYFAGEEAYDPYEQFQRRMYSQMLPRTGAVGTEPYRRLERAARLRRVAPQPACPENGLRDKPSRDYDSTGRLR